MMRSGYWRLLVIGLVALLPFKTAQSMAPNASMTGWPRAGAPAAISRQAKIAATVSLPLLARISAAAPDDKLRVIVRFASVTGAPPASAGARREAAQTLVGHLQRDAQVSQSGALSWLQGPLARNEADNARPFWIFNGLALRATPAVIEALAARSDVLSVSEDRWLQRIRPTTAADAAPEQRVLARALEQPLSMADAPPEPGAVTWGIARIRADQVWRGLGITGTGVTVANIDSGVDWNHPALNANYRGRGNGVAADHLHNWFDATDEGALYPEDADGHGTHTMGTLAGAGGIGVAPGARWMAAKALNRDGYGLDSWIHAAFEFMLAPGGDPSKAPDVLNNSWGNTDGASREFHEDLALLRTAGIFVVFSNGNSGPRVSSVGSPASDPENIGVGATDPDDDIASFSSRGPSPINGAVKPDIAAPGVRVVSSFPGGAYATLNGTSMAAPHVAGTAALIISAKAGIGISETLAVLTQTATGLSATLPNNNSGWGRIDAYAAVASVLPTAAIDGYVRDGAQPVPGATVVINDASTGHVLTTTTDGAGYYALQPLPGVYSISASAFGYSTAALPPRLLTLANAVHVDMDISALASGSVRGTVRNSANGSYITATIRALGTPKLSVSNNNCLPCRYALDLPTGTYVLEARANGFKVQTQTVSISNNSLTDANFSLESTLKVVLVDSGAWYYGSATKQYRDAFEQLRWVADEIRIKNILSDSPSITTLLRYDAVVWSAPFDAPSIVQADGVISAYLSTGRAVILTGQDIAAYDGGLIDGASYFASHINARAVADDAETRTAAGASGTTIQGITLTLAGGDGANNQDTPDIVEPYSADLGGLLATYPKGDGRTYGAATLTAPCSRYRAAHYGFGLESISQQTDRANIVERTLGALFAPKPLTGIELLARDNYARKAAIANDGDVAIHTMRLRNTGAGGVAQKYTISIAGNQWPTTLSSREITLDPCATAIVTATVTIPAGTPRGTSDTLTITARHDSAGLTNGISVTTKTPDSILLVDDDRWFDKESEYLAALAAGGHRADHWDSGNSVGVTRSPTITELRQYHAVVWFNAYDWFDPITTNEQRVLAEYLAGGGRLFLTSQAALAYTERSQIVQHFLGVDAIDFSDATSSVVGMQGTALGDGVPNGSLLPFPYGWNLSSAVQPRPGAHVILRGESGQPFALATIDERWRSVFAPFAVEALPGSARAAFIDGVLSYLAPYGTSSLSTSKRTPAPGEQVTLTFVPRLDDIPLPVGETVSMSWSSSAGLDLLDAPGPHTQLTSAPLAGRSVNARVNAAVSAGTLLTATITIALTQSRMIMRKHVNLRVGGPALSASLVTPNGALSWGDRVTITFSVVNTGGLEARNINAQIVLPPGLHLVEGSLESTPAPSGITANSITFTGTLPPGQLLQGKFVVQLPRFSGIRPSAYFPSLLVNNGMGDTSETGLWLMPRTYRFWFTQVHR